MTCHAHALAASRRMLCKEDVDTIREAAAQIVSGSLVIDLGAGSGTTALAVYGQRVDVQVHSFDENNQMLNWTQQALENAKYLQLGTWSRFQMESAYAARGYDDESVALVICDASHDYDDVKRDLKAWLPKLKLAGLVFVHDYDAEDAPNQYPGVKRAMDDIVERYNLDLIKKIGWGALFEKGLSLERMVDPPTHDAPVTSGMTHGDPTKLDRSVFEESDEGPEAIAQSHRLNQEDELADHEDDAKDSEEEPAVPEEAQGLPEPKPKAKPRRRRSRS